MKKLHKIMKSKYDKELGMDKSITRRDFVIGSSLFLGIAAVGSGIKAHGQPHSPAIILLM